MVKFVRARTRLIRHRPLRTSFGLAFYFADFIHQQLIRRRTDRLLLNCSGLLFFLLLGCVFFECNLTKQKEVFMIYFMNIVGLLFLIALILDTVGVF